MALEARLPLAGGAIHADQSAQATSWVYVRKTNKYSFTLRVGTVADKHGLPGPHRSRP